MTVPPARFVIYAQGRTGSHLLMQLLGAHPRVHCAGEVLNRRHWPGVWQWGRRAALRAPDVYLPWCARRAADVVWGCKIPIATSPRGLSRLATRGWTMLFLQRRSRFDRALSWCVASLTGEFQRSGAQRPAHITIPTDMFRDQLLFRRTWDVRSMRAMRDIPHIPIVYEDDLADASRWDTTCSRLFTALDVPMQSVQPTMRRSFDRPYHDVVTNYARLRTLYEQMDGVSDTPVAP